MDLSGDHASFLARQDFVIPPGDFSPTERELLAKYGRWMEALAVGGLTPVTPSQEKFVRVARAQEEPTTDFELAWTKVAKQRALAPEIIHSFRALAAARAAAANLEADYFAARSAVLAQVRDQLAAVDAAYVARLQEATDNAASCDLKVREVVLRSEHSVRLAGISAVYVAARVTYDAKRLEAYAQEHPEIRQFRKVGKPIVALRFKDQLTMPEPVKPVETENG